MRKELIAGGLRGSGDILSLTKPVLSCGGFYIMHSRSISGFGQKVSQLFRDVAAANYIRKKLYSTFSFSRNARLKSGSFLESVSASLMCPTLSIAQLWSGPLRL